MGNNRDVFSSEQPQATPPHLVYAPGKACLPLATCQYSGSHWRVGVAKHMEAKTLLRGSWCSSRRRTSSARTESTGSEDSGFWPELDRWLHVVAVRMDERG